MKDTENDSSSVRLQDIADRCGVHKATVCRAIRGDRKNVSHEVAHRILTVAKEMGYDPDRNYAARRLSLSKSGQDVLNHMVALFLPSEFAKVPYFQMMFQGIVDVLWEQRFGLVIHDASQISKTEVPYVFARGEIDAAIVVGNWNETVREHYHLGRSPVVSLILETPNCSSVVPDAARGGYLAVKHLLDLGHRRIGHYWNAESKTPRSRTAGYERACNERGLDPADVMYDIGAWKFLDFPANDEVIISAIRRMPDLTAVIAVNDRSAAHITRVMERAGLGVPQDISVVGFDDTDPMLDEKGANLLTTVRMPLVEIGCEAAKLILKRLSKQVSDDVVITVPTEFVVRASTAQAKPRIG
jgi:LacI family transcriptional regulator